MASREDWDWRKTFHSGYVNQKKDKFEVIPVGSRSFTIDGLTLKADNEASRDRWIRELEHAAEEEENVDMFIDDCKRELESVTKSSLPDVLDWMTGILTILKDARTTRDAIAYIGNHLANTGFVGAIVHCFKFTLKLTLKNYLTNAMLQKVASGDECDDVDKILYITRRLIWRLAFASKAFALALTSTDYLHYIVQDLKQVLLLPDQEWKDGNYLIFSSLDVIQQCARSGVKKERLYEFGGVYTISSMLRKTSSNKIQLAAYMALAHMVKEEDVRHLRIDEDFLAYIIDLLKKAIPNTGHNVTIDRASGYYTEVLELFDTLDGLCVLEENRKMIFDKGIIKHIEDVTKSCVNADLTNVTLEEETMSTLRLIDRLCHSTFAKRALKNNETIANSIIALLNVDSQKVKEKAKVVQSRIQSVELPRSLRSLDEDFIMRFKNALRYGTTPDRHIRLMVLGHKGAGKSSLCRRLIDKDLKGIESTEGIDLYVQQLIVDLVTSRWIVQNKGAELDSPVIKLANAMEGTDIDNCDKDDVTVQSHNQTLPQGSADSLEDIDLNASNHSEYKTEEEEESDDEFEDALEYLDLKNEIKGQMTTLEQVLHTRLSHDFNDKIYANISLFDFAGEQIYYESHQMFLAPECVYIIVVDLTEAEKGHKSVIDEARFWLASILDYTAIGKDEGNNTVYNTVCQCPPVLLVGTHKDKLRFKTDKEKENFGLNVLQDLLSAPELERIGKYSFAGMFVVDNTIIDPVIGKLKMAVIDAAKSHEKWERPIPTKWFPLENEVMKLRAKGQKLMEFDSLIELNEALEYPLQQEDITVFLKYLHAEGLVFFEGESMRNLIIIDLQWVINVLKHIITTENMMKRICSPNLHKKQQMLITEAKLFPEYAEEVLKNFDVNLTSCHIKSVLLFMEKMNLISRYAATQPDFWIVPCMLKATHYATVLEELKFDQQIKTCVFYLDTENTGMGNAFSSQMMAACIGKWSLVKVKGRLVLYRNIASFKIDDRWRMLIHIEEAVVQAVIYTFSQEETYIPHGIGEDARLFLEKACKSIIERNQKVAHIRRCVQCTLKIKADSNPVEFTSLMKCREIECCEGMSDHLHVIGLKSLQHWITLENVPTEHKGLSEPIAGTDTVRMVKKQEVTSTFPKFPPLSMKKRELQELSDRKGVLMKAYDDSFTDESLKTVLLCCDSVGMLKSDHGISTVFRVGTNRILTTFHSVEVLMLQKTEQGLILNHENLSGESIVVIFNNELFRLAPCLEAYDANLDYAVLTINPGPNQSLPPPLVPLPTHVPPDLHRLTAIIGFGHTCHERKTVDPHVPILSHTDEQLQQAVLWVQENKKNIQEQLIFCGNDGYKATEAYSVLNRDDKLCLRSIMGKGGSGSPGIVLTPNGPRVIAMLQGGLPSFYWALPEELRNYIPLEFRVEFGIWMGAIQHHIENADIRQDIFPD
ncbi:uncharacterized protein [Argopecten irradians]|uniref:uncharacterized protein n=1 Tax=Argopecten irradians TaxID=31199 RepID=UPI00371546A5